MCRPSRCISRALSIGEKALGADHPDVATSLNNLAYLHDEQGQFSSAYKLALRATSIQENRRFNSTVQSQDKQSVGRANANNLQLLTSLAWKLSNESPSRLLELVEQAFPSGAVIKQFICSSCPSTRWLCDLVLVYQKWPVWCANVRIRCCAGRRWTRS